MKPRHERTLYSVGSTLWQMLGVFLAILLATGILYVGEWIANWLLQILR